MLRASKGASDLIFSPGRAPQVEASGQLIQIKIAGVGTLSSDDTARIAAELMGDNDHAAERLKQDGSCDISYGVRGTLPLPREHLHAARQLRHRHARHSHRRAGLQDALASLRT